MDNLSIFIPMRKGSKRVVNKNSKQFTKEGKSLFEYKISQVIKILDFGAVVEYSEAPGNEVLLHVSEIAWERTNNVSDVLKIGDELTVKYFGIDPRTRKEKVSRKALLPKPEGFETRHNKKPSEDQSKR